MGISENIAGAIGNNLSDTGFGLATEQLFRLSAGDGIGRRRRPSRAYALTAISDERRLSMSAANIMSSTA